MPETKNPFEGIIRLEWPGKQCQLLFDNDKWHFLPLGQVSNIHALLFKDRIGTGSRPAGIAIQGDELKSLDALHSYVPSSLQFIYYDAPRINVFQDRAESGYSTATWLSLVKQIAERVYPCLKREGFIAVHTDEQMSHYARMILDETFGRDCYVGTLVWQKQYAPQNDLNIPTDVLDYIVVYSKVNIAELPKIGILIKPDDLQDDGDFRGCFIDGHKGARSGSEATKFHVNTSPYHWQILNSKLPKGRCHFDPILGVLWFESVEECGDFFVEIQACDKNNHLASKTVHFSVREPKNVEDVYSLPERIWWLLKNDNDIVNGGPLKVVDLPDNLLDAIKGQQFSLVFQASGGNVFSMRSDAPGVNRYWEFGLRTLVNGIAQAKASFGRTGSALPSIKKYFDREDAKKRAAVMNFLPWYDYGHTQDATQHSKALKNAGILEGSINMMAKPQRLLGHLIQLFAPGKKDIVLAMGDVNAVFASVAIKMNRHFIHMIGGSTSDWNDWENLGGRRILATMDGRDSEEIEGSDALPDAAPKKGYVDVLSLSKSYLFRSERNGDIESQFDDNESVDDFWAGLAGAYRDKSHKSEYYRLDGKIVVVVPYEQPLDIVMVARIRKQYGDQKLIIIYESSEGELSAPHATVLKRAPFDLI